jgi:hypothetical protein
MNLDLKKEFPENKSKIEELLKLVNESRTIIYENKLKRLSRCKSEGTRTNQKKRRSPTYLLSNR